MDSTTGLLVHPQLKFNHLNMKLNTYMYMYYI